MTNYNIAKGFIDERNNKIQSSNRNTDGALATIAQLTGINIEDLNKLKTNPPSQNDSITSIKGLFETFGLMDRNIAELKNSVSTLTSITPDIDAQSKQRLAEIFKELTEASRESNAVKQADVKNEGDDKEKILQTKQKEDTKVKDKITDAERNLKTTKEIKKHIRDDTKLSDISKKKITETKLSELNEDIREISKHIQYLTDQLNIALTDQLTTIIGDQEKEDFKNIINNINNTDIKKLWRQNQSILAKNNPNEFYVKARTIVPILIDYVSTIMLYSITREAFQDKNAIDKYKNTANLIISLYIQDKERKELLKASLKLDLILLKKLWSKT